MTMFTLLLLTVLFAVPPNNALEMVFDNNGGCMVDRQFREVIDKFHNELRQKVAEGQGVVKGKSLGPAREMYGLIYDCSLEVEAGHETTLPGFAALFQRGVTRFSREYDGSQRTIEALEEALKSLYDDQNSVNQLIYPKATRFGCTGRLKRGTRKGSRRMEWTCVYDKKPKDGEKLDGGNICTTDKDCTFYKGSTCHWNLCYTWF